MESQAVQAAVEHAEHLIVQRLGPAMERIELKGGAHVGASAKRRHDLGGRQVLPEIGPRRPSEPLECEIDVEDILDREPLVHDFPREGADVRDDRGLGCGSRK